MADNEYITRRLQRMATEELAEARNSVNKVETQAIKNGTYGSGARLTSTHNAVCEVFKRATSRMATFAYQNSEGITPETAQALEAASQKFIVDVTSWMDEKHRNQGYKSRPQWVSNLEETMQEIARHAVDDFQHGVAGDTRMKKDPLANVVANITNSPGAVMMTALGDNNQQSVQQQVSAIREVVENMLASDELNALDDAKRTAVQDTAEVVRDEIAKPSADMSKIRRWVNRLLELAREFGMHVAATALAKVVLG